MNFTEGIIKAVHRQGGRFILCDDDKRPLHRWKNDPHLPTAEEVIDHRRRHGMLGLVPKSLDLAVVDFDAGHDPQHVEELISLVGEPLELIPTPKGCHLIYPARDLKVQKKPWKLREGLHGDFIHDFNWIVRDLEALAVALLNKGECPYIDPSPLFPDGMETSAGASFQGGTGRHDRLFQWLSVLARRNKFRFKSYPSFKDWCRRQAQGWNSEEPAPMEESRCNSIADGISKWTWNNYSGCPWTLEEKRRGGVASGKIRREMTKLPVLDIWRMMEEQPEWGYRRIARAVGWKYPTSVWRVMERIRKNGDPFG